MFKATVIRFMCFLSAAAFVLASDSIPSLGPEAALAKLKDGNVRFYSSKVSESKPVAAERQETAKAQHPFAVIPACADSRTALGSIDYAVEHLGTRLIVVLGHERCGALPPRWRLPCARSFGMPVF